MVSHGLRWPVAQSITAADIGFYQLQGLIAAAAACASWAIVATAMRLWQSIRVRAGTRSQQPELSMKEAEHLAEDLDQAELEAFDDKLGPNSQAAQLALPESTDQSFAESAPAQLRQFRRATFRRSQLAASRPRRRNQVGRGRQQKASNQQKIQQSPAQQTSSSRSWLLRHLFKSAK